jgi:hypothetical protein
LQGIAPENQDKRKGKTGAPGLTAGPGFPLQSFLPAAKKDFHFNPLRGTVEVRKALP